MTDCSVLKPFFENTDHAFNMVQRWKAELLQFGIDIEHRPALMMWECDMLYRYNTTTDSWQEKAIQEKRESEGDMDPEPNEASAVDCGSQELGYDNDHHQEKKASYGDNEPSATEAIAALCGSLELGNGDNPQFRRLATLSPVCYSGDMTCPTIGKRLWEPHISIMVVMAIGVSVEEAMASIGMRAAGSVTHVEYDAN